MIDVNTMNIHIYADGADLKSIRESKKIPFIKGFTTNPTLMRQAGVTDYEAFAREALEVVEGAPLSLEVFSDEFPEMEWQGDGIVMMTMMIPTNKRTAEVVAVEVAKKMGLPMMTLDPTQALRKKLEGGV